MTTPLQQPKKICIVGCGRWGSVIAKIVGRNVLEHSIFAQHVPMWVFEELYNGKKLTEIINKKRENIKYMPGCMIPYNVVAIADLDVATYEADILIFVLPYQFIHDICAKLSGKVKPTAIAISLIKGLDVADGKTGLVSDVIRRSLNIECAALMGANVAPEVSIECFCEATIGCKNAEHGQVLKKLFQTPYFRITVVPDAETVELCGALKEIVLLAALVCDGLGLIANTKAAVVRLGLAEMLAFSQILYPDTHTETFLQSCGIADLITSCYSSKIQVMADSFIKAGSYKGIARIEKIVLEGRKLNGPPAARAVNNLLKSRDLEARFPLFTSIHKICVGDMHPEDLIDQLKHHPVHK
jgi:glycerol-3-phosphate dehydrogenase (NAD+)